MTVVDDIETVLASTIYYSPTTSPEMAERAAAISAMAAKVRTWLPSELPVGDEVVTVAVDFGGQMGGVSATPWVRVFAPAYSPSATEGFYLAYLFAGDGSRVYLSLMQGTSVIRSGHVRPMSDTNVLRERADTARNYFAGWSSDFLQGMHVYIDLAVEGLDGVGEQPKKRARNYQAANVFALAYDANVPATDEQLRSDLDRMLELLQHLYYAVSQPDGATGTGTAVVDGTQPSGAGNGQVWVADSRLRKAIEDYSMKIVMDLYEKTQQWVVDNVSRFRSWNLELKAKKRQDDRGARRGQGNRYPWCLGLSDQERSRSRARVRPYDPRHGSGSDSRRPRCLPGPRRRRTYDLALPAVSGRGAPNSFH